MKYQAANTTHPTTFPNCFKADDTTTVAGELLLEVVAGAAVPLDLLTPDVAAAVVAAPVVAVPDVPGAGNEELPVSPLCVEVSVDNSDDDAGSEAVTVSLREAGGAGAGTGPEVPPTGPFPGGALLLVVFPAAD
jgi:hypothetical protein